MHDVFLKRRCEERNALRRSGCPRPLGYTYSPAGALTSLTYPSGRVVNYALDGADRILSVTGTMIPNTTPYAQNAAYAPQGGLAQMSLGNTNLEQTCYNDRLQTVGIRVGSAPTTASLTGCANGNDSLNLSYLYGGTQNNGNVQSQTIVAGSMLNGTYTINLNVAQNYGYDTVNRLVTATEGSYWQQTYVYDAYGNRAVVYGAAPIYIPGNSVTPVVANNDASLMAGRFPNNQTDLCGTSNGRALGYDTAGNWAGCPALSVSNTFDAENRLMSGTGAAFAYDGGGQRVAKTNSAGTTYYVYDATGQLAAEYSNATPVVGGTQYLTADNLGSTRMVSGGGTITYHDYLPFGEEIGQGIAGRPTSYDSTDGVNQKFTGKERDAETGLDYFGARYLSSAQGRWMSPDWSAAPEPIPYADLTDPQSLNLYGYMRNNPLAHPDVDGHAGCSVSNPTACLYEVATKMLPRVEQAVATGTSLLGEAAGAFVAVLLSPTMAGDPHETDALHAAHDNQNQNQQDTAEPEPQPAANGAGARKGGPPYQATDENVDRMNQGRAPVDTGGKPVELHHVDQSPAGPLQEMTQQEHRGPGNYKQNHPKSNEPSQINRKEFAKQRSEYWKQKAEEIKKKDQ
jgi:RHS repeat-associated protein